MRDTTPSVQRQAIEIVRELGVNGRAERIGELCAAVRALGLAGTRLRHPDADEHEVLMRYLTVTLGSATVEAVYGWSPER